MAIRALLAWDSNDLPSTWNDRFRSIFKVGVYSGGTSTPAATPLHVTVSPFVAVSFDGMVVRDDDEAHDIPLTDNADQLICLLAKYREFDDPILQWQVILTSSLPAHPDKDYLIIFARAITVGGVITSLEPWAEHRIDGVSRHPLRPPVATTGDLPLTGNVVGDVIPVLADASLWIWEADNTWHPHYANIDPFVLTITSALMGYSESLRYGNGTGIIAGGSAYEEKPGSWPTQDGSLSDYRTEVRAQVQAGLQNLELAVEGFSAMLNGHFLKTYPVTLPLVPQPTSGAWPQYAVCLEYYREQLTTDPDVTTPYYKRYTTRALTAPGDPVDATILDLLPIVDTQEQNTELNFDYFPIEITGKNVWVRARWQLTVKPINSTLANSSHVPPQHLHNYFKVDPLAVWGGATTYALETGGPGPNPYWGENLYIGTKADAYQGIAYMIPLFVVRTDGTLPLPTTQSPWTYPAGGTQLRLGLWSVYPRVRDNLQQLGTDHQLLKHFSELAEQRSRRCSGFVDFGGYRWSGGAANSVWWERENLQPPVEYGPEAKHVAVQVDGFVARLPFLAQQVFMATLPAPPSELGSYRRDLVYLTMRRVLNPIPTTMLQAATPPSWFVDTGIPVSYYEYVNDVTNTPAKRLASGTLKYQLRVEVAEAGDAFDEFSAFYQYNGEAPKLDVDGRPLARNLNGVLYHRHASDPGLWVGVEDLRNFVDQRPVLQSVWPSESEPTAIEPPVANDTARNRNDQLITDGMVYAIPLALVHRRNTATYDPCANPNGTTASRNAQSYRPDGAIDATLVLLREILDLRHLVELVGTDLESVLYRSLDLNVQGKLFTSFGFDELGGVVVRDRLGAEILRTEQLGGDPCSDELAPPDGKRLLWSDSEEYYSRPLHQRLDDVQLGQGFDLSIQPSGWWGTDPTYNSQLALQPYTLEGRNIVGQVGTPANGTPPNAGTPVPDGGALRLVRGSVMYMLEDGLSIPPAYVMAYPNIATRRVAVFDTMDWESAAPTPNLDGCELRHHSTAAYELLEEVAWGMYVSTSPDLRTWLGYAGADPQDLTNYHGTELFTAVYERYYGRVNHGLKFTPTRALLGFRHEDITQPQPATVDDYVFPDIPHLRLRVKPTKVVEYAFYQWNGSVWNTVSAPPDATIRPLDPVVGQTVHVTTPGPYEGYWVWNGAAWDLIAVVTTLPVSGTYVGIVVHYMEPLGNILWKFTIPFSDLYRATAEQLYGDPTANIDHLGSLLSSCVFPIEVNDGETPVALYGYEVHGSDSVDIYVKSLPESTNIDYSGYGADPQAHPWPDFNLGRTALAMPAVDANKYYNVMVGVRFDHLFTGYRLGKANRSVEALYEWRTQYLYNGEGNRIIHSHTSTLDSVFNTAVVARDGVILAAHVYRVPTTSEKLAGKTKNLWVTNHRLAPSGYLGTNFVPFCLLFDQDGYINPIGAPDHNVYMVHYLVHRPVKTCERVLVNYLFAPYQGIVRDNQDAMLKLQGKALRVSDIFTTGYGAYAPWLNYWLIDPLWTQPTPNQGVRTLEDAFERAWYPTLRHDLYFNYANLLGYLPFPKLDSIGIIVKNQNCGQLEGWNIDEGDIKPPVFRSQVLPPGLVRRHRRPDLFYSLYGFTDPLLAELAAFNPFGGELTMFIMGLLGPSRAVPWFAYFRNSKTSTLNLGYNQLHQINGFGYPSTDPLQAFHSLLRLSGTQQAAFANDNIVPGRRGWLFTETYASHDLIMQLPKIHPQICQVRYPSGNVFFGPDGDYWNRVAAPDGTGAQQFPGQFGVAWAGQDMDYPLIGVGRAEDPDSHQLELSLLQNPPEEPTQVTLSGRSITPPSLVRASLYNYLGMLLQHPSGDLLLQITCGYSCNPVFSPVGGIYDGFVPLYRPLVRDNQLDRHKSTYGYEPYLLPDPNGALAPLANAGTYCLSTPPGPGPGHDVPFTVCIDKFTVTGQGSNITGHWGGLPTVPPQIMVGIWTSEAERLAHPYNPDRIIKQGVNNFGGVGNPPVFSTFAYDASALRGTYHVQVTAMPGNSVSVTITKPDSTTVNLGPIAFNPYNPGDSVAFVIDAHLTITTTVGIVVTWNASTNFNYLLHTSAVGNVLDPGVTCTCNPTGDWLVVFSLNVYPGVVTDRVVVWLVDGAHAADNYLPTDRLCDPAVATIGDID
jgi:hypothetical protein